MASVSIVEIPGEPDKLLAAYDEIVDQMADSATPDALADACVATDDGIMLVHLWNSEEDFRKNWDDPELARVAAEAGMPAESAMRVTVRRAHKHHVDP